jgi:hypothetical protein
LGEGNATTGAAAQTLVPQRKGMNLMQQKHAPAQKGVTPAGTRSAVPERELKALSSRPIGEVVEEVVYGVCGEHRVPFEDCQCLW